MNSHALEQVLRRKSIPRGQITLLKELYERDFDECEGASSRFASKCPSSVSPHAVRKGSITYHRNNGWPAKAVSDRADVSQEVLDKHYDKGSKSEKRERRKEFLNKI